MLQRLWLFILLYELKFLHDQYSLVGQRVTRRDHHIGPHFQVILLELQDVISVTLPANQA